jgi:hypothetical protein
LSEISNQLDSYKGVKFSTSFKCKDIHPSSSRNLINGEFTRLFQCFADYSNIDPKLKLSEASQDMSGFTYPADRGRERCCWRRKNVKEPLV